MTLHFPFRAIEAVRAVPGHRTRGRSDDIGDRSKRLRIQPITKGNSATMSRANPVQGCGPNPVEEFCHSTSECLGGFPVGDLTDPAIQVVVRATTVRESQKEMHEAQQTLPVLRAVSKHQFE